MTTSASASNFSLAGPDEVLAYIPHALGFHPRNSAVLLIMQKAGLAATLRVDLPAGHHEQADDRIWVRQLVNLVGKVPQADAVFIAFYTGQSPEGAEDWPPRQPLLQGLTSALMRGGILVRDGWHVGPERWHSYFCGSEECCPAEGFALPDLALTETHLRMVVAGSAPEKNLWDGSGVAEWPNKEAVRAQVREVLEGSSGSGPRERLIAGWAALLDTAPAAAERKMRGTESVAGSLLASLHDKTVRDLLPYLAGRGKEHAMLAFREVTGAVDFSGASQDFSDFLLGTGGVQPDWDRMDRLWYICRDLLGAASGRDQTALLCLLAWIEWAKGRGSSALNLLKAALRTDPGYRLAQLLLRLLEAGEMPSWVADPDRAWHRKLDGRLSA
ncbi:DUF4192 domain-containing protein [Paeniglutamicibacter sp. R2-26]|uniref:DUF4192 domain-containing protein n=1 Tax=Paeniglutamicibacter sp. R2-26 TaxID=3144417 RepID=UPI003EE4E8EA